MECKAVSGSIPHVAGVYASRIAERARGFRRWDLVS